MGYEMGRRTRITLYTGLLRASGHTITFLTAAGALNEVEEWRRWFSRLKPFVTVRKIRG